jgi:hypothetical protein
MSALERLKQRRAAAQAAGGGQPPGEPRGGGGGAARQQQQHEESGCGGGAASSPARAAPRGPGAKPTSAAAAHEANDAYMARFAEALTLAQGRPPGAGGARQSAAAAEGRGGEAAAGAAAPLAAHRPTAPTPQPRGVGAAHLAPAWRAGPTDATGAAHALSERPLLCSAARAGGGPGGGGEVVLGSADHALYVVDAATATKRRTLFSCTAGHKE